MSSEDASSCEQNQLKKLDWFLVRSMPWRHSITVHSQDGVSAISSFIYTAFDLRGRVLAPDSFGCCTISTMTKTMASVAPIKHRLVLVLLFLCDNCPACKCRLLFLFLLWLGRVAVSQLLTHIEVWSGAGKPDTSYSFIERNQPKRFWFFWRWDYCKIW